MMRCRCRDQNSFTTERDYERNFYDLAYDKTQEVRYKRTLSADIIYFMLFDNSKHLV